MARVVLPEDSTKEISELIDVLISLLFESLPRRDQRNWARVYLNGLVRTTGKKTIRNIAGTGASSVEQSLQQFISKSPWDWTPVRRSLAQHLERTAQRPLAWVIQPMVIEKAGDRSVGVGRQFVPQLGRTANCQQAGGIWLASSEASFPVEWTLTLPGPWTSELLRRRRAGIPDTARSLTPAQDAVHAVQRMAATWQLQRRPVVMEVANGDLPQSIESFALHDIPFVFKVDGSLPVSFGGAGRHKPGPHTAPARELIDSLRSQRRVVEWTRHGRAEGAVTLLTSASILATPCEDRPLPAPMPLLLLGAWTEAALLPSEFWITNIGDRPLAQLFLLAKLTDRVSLDFAETCEPVGIRDFEGRSFRGWHHHATLASVAHAAKLLGARPQVPEGFPGPTRSAAAAARPATRPATPAVLPPRPILPGQIPRREYIR
ncbi:MULTISPECIES: transposase [unclassified Streptomyces]|uniref:IS701 family transposase n=1 Tax=unclassified Streptomyces TaxID=2593676 RepID=UPI002DD83F74|nr:transposase [Streptomyces sp. NBC_01294]WRZ60433.1 transposase [Streptomyces sp. NBC_01294]